jgi:AcrR family transcriptional regulator
MCDNGFIGKHIRMNTDQKRTKSAKLSGKSQPDRRLAKTRTSLAMALFNLMQRFDWDDISVQDICDTADVARSSFYAHFDSKIMLLDHTIVRSLEHSREARRKQAGPMGLLAWIVDHVTENRTMFNRVARGGGAQIVLSRFKAALCNELAEELRLLGSASPALQAHFILGGTFDTLVAWSKTWKASQLPAVKADILSIAARISDASAQLRD